MLTEKEKQHYIELIKDADNIIATIRFMAERDRTIAFEVLLTHFLKKYDLSKNPPTQING